MCTFILKSKIIIFILLLASYNAVGQQAYDLSNISADKIQIDSRLVLGNENNLRNILYTAIDASLSNIGNRNTTFTFEPNIPYRYQYLIVHSDFSFSIGEREKYKYIYNPNSPDVIRDGDHEGYVRYPDIDIKQEYSDVMAMIEILRIIDNILEYGITANCNTNNRQIYLLNIANDKIIIDSRLITGNDRELGNILLTTMELSMDNIIEFLSDLINVSYQYKYLTVNPDFSFSIMQKEVERHHNNFETTDTEIFIKRINNTTTIYELHPSVLIWREIFDIWAMIDILRIMDDLE